MPKPTLKSLEERIDSLHLSLQHEIIMRSTLQAKLDESTALIKALSAFCDEANVQITKLTIKAGGVENISYMLPDESSPTGFITIN